MNKERARGPLVCLREEEDLKEVQQVEDLCEKIKICSGILYHFISVFGNCVCAINTIFFFF